VTLVVAAGDGWRGGRRERSALAGDGSAGRYCGFSPIGVAFYTDCARSREGDNPGMFQLRIHGRGGQGVVTAAELVSIAAFIEGRHAQAFPSFGSERTGAPVVAFCRIDDREIRSREPIAEPDALIVQDPTLLHQVDVFSGLRPDGFILINSARGFGELGLGDLFERHRRERLLTVPATDLAREHLGRPIPNAVLLGGFAALSGLISLDAVTAAIRKKFSGKLGAWNAAAATAAFELVERETTELTHA
jgi:pyruvate ferredoxin oxidoreductase gamma subunit